MRSPMKRWPRSSGEDKTPKRFMRHSVVRLTPQSARVLCWLKPSKVMAWARLRKVATRLTRRRILAPRSVVLAPVRGVFRCRTARWSKPLFIAPRRTVKKCATCTQGAKPWGGICPPVKLLASRCPRRRQSSLPFLMLVQSEPCRPLPVWCGC